MAMKRRMPLVIAVLLSILALLYPPYALEGPLSVVADDGWGFLFGNVAEGFGQEVRVYDHIDWQLLIMELVLVWVVGLVIHQVARRG